MASGPPSTKLSPRVKPLVTPLIRVRDWWKKLKNHRSNLFSSCNERKCEKTQQLSQHQICRQNIRHQKFIWKHHIYCHVKISEVATLVSMIPNFWCCLEVAATQLHLCFVIKGNVWWKRTFLPMRWLLSLCYIINTWKLFKPFTPHVIAWSVRKGFNQSIRRTKEQKTRLQYLASTMPKPVMPSGAMKSAKLLRKNARIWQC